MEYEWDEAKAAANLAKHEISFKAAVLMFSDPNRIDRDSTRRDDGEMRRIAIGQIGDRIVAVIYTMRPTGTRIISARKARRDERFDYRQGSRPG